MKKLKLLFLGLICLSLFTGCNKKEDNYVTVYSAGDYINPDVIPIFEKETGIHVIYEEYDTNEVMYTKINTPNSTYDIVCTSDYMIQKLISENKIDKINYSKVPNYKHISNKILDMSKSFDNNLEYTVPYCYGTLGILYNKKYISEDEVKSFNVLWDEKYKDEVLMPDNVRDLLSIALKKNHFSLNTKDPDELKIALDDLISQKDNVQAYVNDQVKDKMISEEAKLAIAYSGDALFTQTYNENLDYSIPDEGSNLWIDAWTVLKTAKNKENGLKFINFMTRPDIAAMNYEYLAYSTPNTSAIDLVEDESLKTSEIVIPTDSDILKCEVMRDLGYDGNRKYNEIFMKVKIH